MTWGWPQWECSKQDITLSHHPSSRSGEARFGSAAQVVQHPPGISSPAFNRNPGCRGAPAPDLPVVILDAQGILRAYWVAGTYPWGAGDVKRGRLLVNLARCRYAVWVVQDPSTKAVS